MAISVPLLAVSYSGSPPALPAFSYPLNPFEIDICNKEREFLQTKFEHLPRIGCLAQEIQIFNPRIRQWEDIKYSTVVSLIDLKYRDHHIKQFLKRGIDLEKMLKLSGYFAPAKGDELFAQVWDMAHQIDLSLDRLENFIQRMGTEKEICFFNPANRLNGLALVASYDHNGGLTSDPGFYHAISKTYNYCINKIADFSGFCSAIAEGITPWDLLIIVAHGSWDRFAIAKNSFVRVGDELRSCLGNLSRKATVIIDSCKTGAGRESWPNLANHIFNSAPEGIRLFASDELISSQGVTRMDPLEVRFDSSTYLIDPANKEKHCSANSISFLSMCPQSPFFRTEQQNGDIVLQFLNTSTGLWSKVSEDCLKYFTRNKFGNEALAAISNSRVTLAQFVGLHQLLPHWNFDQLIDNGALIRPIDSAQDGSSFEFFHRQTGQWEKIGGLEKKLFELEDFTPASWNTLSNCRLTLHQMALLRDVFFPFHTIQELIATADFFRWTDCFEFFQQRSGRWEQVEWHFPLLFSSKVLQAVSNSHWSLSDFNYFKKQLFERRDPEELIPLIDLFRPVYKEGFLPAYFEFFNRRLGRWQKVNFSAVNFLYDLNRSNENLQTLIDRDATLEEFATFESNPHWKDKDEL